MSVSGATTTAASAPSTAAIRDDDEEDESAYAQSKIDTSPKYLQSGISRALQHPDSGNARAPIPMPYSMSAQQPVVAAQSDSPISSEFRRFSLSPTLSSPSHSSNGHSVVNKNGIPFPPLSQSPKTAYVAAPASPRLHTSDLDYTWNHASSSNARTHFRHQSSPVIGGNGTRRLSGEQELSTSPVSITRKRRTSADLYAVTGASPPFATAGTSPMRSSPVSPTSPLANFKKSSSPWLGLTDTSHLGSSPLSSSQSAPNLAHHPQAHTHRPILGLRHTASSPLPRSPQMLPMMPHHHSNPPPGASPLSPSVFAVAGAGHDISAMPELTLPAATGGLDDRWPAPQQIQAAVSHTHAANAEGQLLSPPNPRRLSFTEAPLPTLFSTSPMTPPGAAAKLPPSPSSSTSSSGTEHGISDDFEGNYDLSAMLNRRRKRSSRGSSGSLSGRSKSRNSSLERKLSIEDDTERELTPEVIVHHKRPDLAMPERSGWEYSDEESESEEEADGELGSPDAKAEDIEPFAFDSDPGLFRASRRSPGASDEASRRRSPSPRQRSPSSPRSPVSPVDGSEISPTEMKLPDEISTALLDARRDSLDVTDDDTLSILERIFILSKSEYKEHRMAVTRALPQWLEQVDICPAFEYILPLLNGLAADDDEVKICLAQGLDRIMFHFFSRCPLADSEHAHAPATSQETDADTRSLDDLHQPIEIERTASATQLESSIHSASSLPPVRLPRIPVGAFTPILGLLLMEPNIEVSSWARAAVVRFLCRLNEKTIPPSFQDDEESPDALDLVNAHKGTGDEHPHQQYTLTNAAKAALEEQIIVDVVLGLARLEGDEEDEGKSDADQHGDQAAPLPIDSRAGPSSSSGGNGAESHAATAESPEDEGEWAHEDSSPDWGMSLRSYASDPSTRSQSESNNGSHNDDNRHARHTSSGTSVFDPDNEAIQGKVASIELVAAIVGAECVHQDKINQNFISEIERMAADQAQRVRSVAASAIGPLAKSLPQELVVSVLLPLVDTFSRDPQSVVRRWTCLVLPDVSNSLPMNLRHRRAIEAVVLFSQDSSRDVRSALSEIAGPMIYSFKDFTIPSELLNWYLGKPIGASVFSPELSPPILPALTAAMASMSMPTVATNDEPESPMAEKRLGMLKMGHNTDPERALLSAYNLPGVALTLGSENWHLLSDFFSQLAENRQVSVRKCLAGSLHVVADIIGSNAASRDILPVAETFLQDVTDVREPVLTHFAALCMALPKSDAPGFVRRVQQSLFTGDPPPPWRSREVVASQLVRLIERFMQDDGNRQLSPAEDDPDESFPNLVHSLMKDEVAAVRNEAVKAIPTVFKASKAHEGSISPMHVFLRTRFATDASYRHRALYATCISLMIDEGLTAEDFGRLFLPDLSALSTDPILNVRAEVSKLCRRALTLSFQEQLASQTRSDFLEICNRLFNDANALVREQLGPFDPPALSDGSLYRMPSLSSEFSSTPPSEPGLNGYSGSDRSEDGNEEDDPMYASQLTSSTLHDLKNLPLSKLDQLNTESDWPDVQSFKRNNDQMLYDDV